MIRMAAILLLIGCGASSQKPGIDAAMDNDALRRESFEATLRVLDEHPDYVDELFAATLKHPRTLDRFLANTARGLEKESLARPTAAHLARYPKGLKQILIANLDEISDDPAALDAVAQAMAQRPQIAAMAIAQRQEALRVTMSALIDEVMKNAKARKAFLASLQEKSPQLAQLIANNPEVLGTMIEALAAAGAKRGKHELEELKQDIESPH
jgi:hypothetical protein